MTFGKSFPMAGGCHSWGLLGLHGLFRQGPKGPKTAPAVATLSAPDALKVLCGGWHGGFRCPRRETCSETCAFAAKKLERTRHGHVHMPHMQPNATCFSAKNV